MIKKLQLTAALLGFCLASAVQADSTLVYEKSGKDGNKTTNTLSISGRWLRIDSDAKGKPDYMLMDTGRMILFEIDDSAKSYKVTRIGKFYWPEVPEPVFRPKMEREKLVVGIRCRQVQEMSPEKPVAEHCMATGAQLGLNAREMKTLSRLFVIARRIGWDWPSVSTPDERMASILSRNRSTGVNQQFVSVEHKGIPDNRLKIPDTYKRIMAEQKKPAKEKTPDAAAPEAAAPEAAAPEAAAPEAAAPEAAAPEAAAPEAAAPEAAATPETAAPPKPE